MPWRPHATAAAVIEERGRFLLVEELADGRTVLNQPAGHLEPGESLIDAVCREVLEETAHRFRPEGLVGIYLYPHPDPSSGITYLRVCFHGPSLGHDPERPLDEGIIRPLWLTRDELAAAPERLRSPMVLRCIDDYLCGRRFPLDLLNHCID
ncbi:MAG: NUDIX hydrolase [Gammaproteobacteria bacterium]|nr:MAG: NUDIX hydrolase [Gammaproteobacteria bacterium]